MANPPQPWQPLLDSLEKLRGQWPGASWGWDPRFKSVASSFDKEIADRARAAMVGVLDDEWSPTGISGAPPDVRALAGKYGGIRPGQLLFTGGSADGMYLFGLWWPWGDGATISLRVGVANCNRPTEVYPQVRALFRIA
jgi:hypothetical protein